MLQPKSVYLVYFELKLFIYFLLHTVFVCRTKRLSFQICFLFLVYHMQEDGWIKVCKEDVSELIHRYKKGMF